MSGKRWPQRANERPCRESLTMKRANLLALYTCELVETDVGEMGERGNFSL
jgi:hypothetical protein